MPRKLNIISSFFLREMQETEVVKLLSFLSDPQRKPNTKMSAECVKHNYRTGNLAYMLSVKDPAFYQTIKILTDETGKQIVQLTSLHPNQRPELQRRGTPTAGNKAGLL